MAMYPRSSIQLCAIGKPATIEFRVRRTARSNPEGACAAQNASPTCSHPRVLRPRYGARRVCACLPGNNRFFSSARALAADLDPGQRGRSETRSARPGTTPPAPALGGVSCMPRYGPETLMGGSRPESPSDMFDVASSRSPGGPAAERSSEPGLASEDAIDMPMYTRKTPPGLTCALLVVVVSLCAGILLVGGLYAKQQDLAARTKENQQAICDTTHCRAHGACRLNADGTFHSCNCDHGWSGAACEEARKKPTTGCAKCPTGRPYSYGSEAAGFYCCGNKTVLPPRCAQLRKGQIAQVSGKFLAGGTCQSCIGGSHAPAGFTAPADGAFCSDFPTDGADCSSAKPVCCLVPGSTFGCQGISGCELRPSVHPPTHVCSFCQGFTQELQLLQVANDKNATRLLRPDFVGDDLAHAVDFLATQGGDHQRVASVCPLREMRSHAGNITVEADHTLAIAGSTTPTPPEQMNATRLWARFSVSGGLFVKSVTMCDQTLDNRYNTPNISIGGGAAAEVTSGGKLFATAVQFLNLTNTGEGGAVFVGTGGHAQFHYCLFDGCHSTNTIRPRCHGNSGPCGGCGGGALTFFPGSTGIIAYSVLRNNRAGCAGGAIWVSNLLVDPSGNPYSQLDPFQFNVTITDTTFENNQGDPADHGRDIYIWRGEKRGTVPCNAPGKNCDKGYNCCFNIADFDTGVSVVLPSA